jgi:hypothetical protein
LVKLDRFLLKPWISSIEQEPKDHVIKQWKKWLVWFLCNGIDASCR